MNNTFGSEAFGGTSSLVSSQDLIRTLEEIKADIANRLFGNEFLPSFVERTEDLQDFFNAVAEFLSPYVHTLESFLGIYDDPELLKFYLEKRGMFIVEGTSLFDLQMICDSQINILMARGTQNSLPEIKRLANEDVQTDLTSVAKEDFGWWMGRTSPGYTTPSVNSGINLCFMNSGPIALFKIKNQNVKYSDEQIVELLRKYFEPKHIHSYYKFL